MADRSDTHEGAEGPLVGAIAAFGGFISSLGTDTAEFSQRLKRRPRSTDVEAMTRSVTNGSQAEIDPKKEITSKQFYHLAYRMAAKSYDDDLNHNFRKPRSNSRLTAMREMVAAKKAKGGRAYQISSATAHYAGDLTATGARGESLRSGCIRLSDNTA
jgi:sterol 3beta-glucosyltransferase